MILHSMAASPFLQAEEARWSQIRKHRVGQSSATLRWQVPPVAAEAERVGRQQSPTLPAAPLVEPAVLTWNQDHPQANPSSVRLTSQISPIDPFEDPFGDRRVNNDPPTGRSYPTRTQVVPQDTDESLPPPTTNGQLAPVLPFEDQAPAPSEDMFPEPDETPRSPLAPLQPSQPCDRIYNRRNCCTEGERCRKNRVSIRETTIDKISLDISPSFKPDATSAAEEAEARTLKLAESAIRTWRNRDGEVVARGQVTDLQFGRILIEQEDGEIRKIAVRELGDDEWCFLAAWWGVPTECSLGDDIHQPRQWLASTMTWKASALCHKPLYFEEVQVERYGHTAGPILQPALSGAHFFLNLATLPYQMGINPPQECEYALGYYRPGSCAPWLVPPVPLSVRGGLMQAGAVVGGIFVIP